jgi:hypothetical protein
LPLDHALVVGLLVPVRDQELGAFGPDFLVPVERELNAVLALRIGAPQTNSVSSEPKNSAVSAMPSFTSLKTDSVRAMRASSGVGFMT